MKAILGKKVGMTQVFNDKGVVTPVTVIEAGPCVVTQLRTKEKDGYEAVQIGFGEAKKIARPQEGHLKKIKNDLKLRFLKEIRLSDVKEEIEVEGEASNNQHFNLGDEIKADVFSEGDLVQATAISKGKGFAGVIKRHNFHRGPMSHGSHHHRKPGSIGAMYPQHVLKGKKLPGRMGHEKVTLKNVKIIKIDVENNMIAVKGSIPGPNKGLVLLKVK